MQSKKYLNVSDVTPPKRGEKGVCLCLGDTWHLRISRQAARVGHHVCRLLTKWNGPFFRLTFFSIFCLYFIAFSLACTTLACFPTYLTLYS